MTKVGLIRLIECRPCKWVFDVRLYGYIERIDNDQAILRPQRDTDPPNGHGQVWTDKLTRIKL